MLSFFIVNEFPFTKKVHGNITLIGQKIQVIAQKRELQTGRLRIRTIMEPGPFLNNDSSFRSGFDLEHILLVPNLV